MKTARCQINDFMVFSAWNLCLRFSDSHVKNTKYTLLSGCQPCGEIWSGEGYLKSMFPQHSHLNVFFGAQISKLSIKNKTSWTLLSLSGKRRLSYHQNLLVNATVTIIINGRKCPTVQQAQWLLSLAIVLRCFFKCSCFVPQVFFQILNIRQGFVISKF